MFNTQFWWVKKNMLSFKNNLMTEFWNHCYQQSIMITMKVYTWSNCLFCFIFYYSWSYLCETSPLNIFKFVISSYSTMLMLKSTIIWWAYYALVKLSFFFSTLLAFFFRTMLVKAHQRKCNCSFSHKYYL